MFVVFRPLVLSLVLLIVTGVSLNASAQRGGVTVIGPDPVVEESTPSRGNLVLPSKERTPVTRPAPDTSSIYYSTNGYYERAKAFVRSFELTQEQYDMYVAINDTLINSPEVREIESLTEQLFTIRRGISRDMPQDELEAALAMMRSTQARLAELRNSVTMLEWRVSGELIDILTKEQMAVLLMNMLLPQR